MPARDILVFNFMNNKINILLVEAEPVLAATIKRSLEKHEYAINIAVNGVDGWNQYKQGNPDVCIINVTLPRKDGFSLLSEIRMVDERVPIIFLTARPRAEDILQGLELGADDCMKKPFSMEELALRLKVMVRRRNIIFSPRYSSGETHKIGRFTFNYQRLELAREKEVIQLAQREAGLLRLLIESRNDLLDRKTALIKLWGEDDNFAARSMDVYITRIRKHLRTDSSVAIVNIRGKGYSLIEYA